MFLDMLAWGAEHEAKRIKEATLEGPRAGEVDGRWVGRPPFGFITDDCYLQPNDEYANAVEAIHVKENLDWSDRRITRHTDVPQRTVAQILGRRGLYKIDSRDHDQAADLGDNGGGPDASRPP